MFKIEVTGHSILELSDKLLAIGQGLRAVPAAPTAVDVSVSVGLPTNKGTEIVFEPSVGNAPASASTADVPSATLDSAPGTPTAETAPCLSEISADGLKELVLSVVRLKGRDAMVAVLDTFGVAKATDVPAAQSAELVAALEGLLK
jgi:hypothetical protein